MNRSFIGIIGLIMLLTITGCARISNSSYFQSRNNKYLTSNNAPPLVVPTGLSNDKIKNYYVINPVKGQAGVSDMPPGMKVTNAKTAALPQYLPRISAKRIKSGNYNGHAALLVTENASQTWLIVGSGLRRQKIPVMEMNSAENSYLIRSRNPYRVQIQARDDRHSWVYITDKSGNPVSDDISSHLLTSISYGMQNKSYGFWSKIL